MVTASLCLPSEEEISAMKKELDKYGINMPSFGKIGGILANEVMLMQWCLQLYIGMSMLIFVVVVARSLGVLRI